MVGIRPERRHRLGRAANGIRHEVEIEPRWLLSDVLRHQFGRTGTHVGCEHGVCGCCTPRLLMCGVSIYRDAPEMSEQELREAIGGQLCRCTGYVGIVDAIRDAGEGASTSPDDPDRVASGFSPGARS